MTVQNLSSIDKLIWKGSFALVWATFHSPRMSTRLVIEPVPKDNEEPEEKIEEDMSDRIGREKVEEESR